MKLGKIALGSGLVVGVLFNAVILKHVSIFSVVAVISGAVLVVLGFKDRMGKKVEK